MAKVPHEVVQENYLLKATFFFKKLADLEFIGIVERVKDIAQSHNGHLAWDKRAELGIAEDAWQELLKHKVNPVRVFVHPNILKTYPSLLKYYRCLALLPQKGLQALSGVSAVKSYEQSGKEIPDGQMLKLVVAINEFISSLILLNGWFREEYLKALVYSTAGTTIEGSWRNAIGEEGERVIKRILINGLGRNGEIALFILKNGKQRKNTSKEYEEVDENSIRTIVLANNYQLTFKAEPDCTISDPNGITVGGVEVKAGLDPAGALERLGAMLKSFDNIKQAYPSAQTILVASCITKEVEARIRESHTVNFTYMLTDITLKKRDAEARFVNKVRELCRLAGKRL